MTMRANYDEPTTNSASLDMDAKTKECDDDDSDDDNNSSSC
jgi:hypothetical protein